MPFDLRPEQRTWLEELLAASEGHSNVCGQAITSFGKTRACAEIVKGALDEGHRVMVTVPRHELIDQTHLEYQRMGIKHGIIASGYEPFPEAHVQIVTPQSALARIKKYGTQYLPVTLAIDDECHNAGSPTYENLYDAIPGLEYRFGVSGTPIRSSGVGLGRCYSKMVLSPQPMEMLELGERIVEPICFSPPVVSRDDQARFQKFAGDYSIKSQAAVLKNKTICVDVVKAYESIAPGTQALVFCSTVEHAHFLCSAFNASGHPAAVLFAGMPKKERRDLVDVFRKGTLRILLNCEIVTEGFNVEGVETVIFARKTQSLRLWLQIIGRALRWQKGKTCCWVIDCVGNFWLNGHPLADRSWSLIDGGTGAVYVSPIKQCQTCFRWVRKVVKTCYCGAEFRGKERVFDFNPDGKLVVVEGEEAKVETRMERFNREIKGAESFTEVLEAAERAGYTPKYARMRWDMKVAARNGEFFQHMRKMGWKNKARQKRKKASG